MRLRSIHNGIPDFVNGGASKIQALLYTLKAFIFKELSDLQDSIYAELSKTAGISDIETMTHLAIVKASYKYLRE